MRILIKWVIAITLIFSSFLVSTYNWSIGEYNYDSSRKFENFDAFYQSELGLSLKENVRPNNEELLVRVSEEKTPITIVYIHGFGASRGEGEEVTNKLTEYFGANTYYLRLPGHGTNPEDHLRTPFQSYLQDAEDSLIYAKELGHKTVLVGTSMGGNIASYLAAKHPELVDSLILASPFYDFDDPSAHIFRFHWGESFINAIKGKMRISKTDPKDESAKYWYLDQYFGAIKNILELKRFVDQNNPYPKISTPTLLMYYYKSEREHDFVASVPAMLKVYDLIESGPNHSPLNKLLKIENGSHVLLSKYVKTDKELIEKEVIQFIKDSTGAEEAPKSKKPKR